MEHLIGGSFLSRLIAVSSLNVALLAIAASCIPGANSPQVPISALPGEVSRPELQTPDERLARLQAVTARRSTPSDITRDIELLLKAEALNSKSQWSKAVAEWEKVLEITEGPYLHAGFEGWLTAYLGTIESSKQSSLVPRLVWTDLQRHLSQDRQLELRVATEVQVRDYLSKHRGWRLEKPADATETIPSNGGLEGLSTANAEPLKEDPLFVQFADHYCKSLGNEKEKPSHLKHGIWHTINRWEKNQPKPVQLYWQGLVSQCAGQAQQAIDLFTKSHLELANKWSSRALAVEATSRLALLQRRNDRRTEAADTYLTLMKLWNLSGLSPKSLGLGRQDFHVRKINDALWAARYRAYVGDYQNGKIFAQRALKNLEEAYSALRLKNQRDKETFAELKAEAYHILAYRIAIEEGELESARSLSLIAKQIPHINTIWSERFTWSIGLYDYMSKDFKGAKVHWEELLNTTQDSNLKAQLYFWLARVHRELARPDEGQFYLSVLAKEAPLSFYNTVAIEVAGLQSPAPWWQSFGSPKQLIDRLQSEDNFGLDQIRADKSLGRLLNRAEILVKAEVTPYSQMALDELRVAVGRRLKMSQHPGPYIYLSRLQYAAGLYRQSMGTSATLARVHDDFWQLHPEQLLISYPRPFLSFYRKAAQEVGVDQELLFAISRQESAFKPGARSPADAFGLMQLIKTTARRFVDQLPSASSGNKSDISVEQLLDPESNISLGALYLATLHQHFDGQTPAIIGGYNAGEAAIDMWLRNRPAEDQLLFVELIPFGETKNYVKKVWRNLAIYRHLDQTEDGLQTGRPLSISIGGNLDAAKVPSPPQDSQ